MSQPGSSVSASLSLGRTISIIGAETDVKKERKQKETNITKSLDLWNGYLVGNYYNKNVLPHCIHDYVASFLETK